MKMQTKKWNAKRDSFTANVAQHPIIPVAADCFHCRQVVKSLLYVKINVTLKQMNANEGSELVCWFVKRGSDNKYKRRTGRTEMSEMHKVD